MIEIMVPAYIAHAHLKIHLKSILDVLQSRNLNLNTIHLSRVFFWVENQ